MATNRIDSLIGATTRIEGNVFFSGALRVDGAVRGNVTAAPDKSSTLLVSEHARVDGEVRAAHIVVNGTLNGSLYATESLELQPSASVKADLHYKSIKAHHGAMVEGQLVHQESAAVNPTELKLASVGPKG